MKQTEDTHTVDIEDVMVWSDGTWCYRYELGEFKHISDDYTTLYFGTYKYIDFFENLLGE